MRVSSSIRTARQAEERVPRLANVVYHNKLGSQLQRVQRLQKLAGQVARLLQADVAQAERAAMLAKADLLTDMVGEFPELQGIMAVTMRATTAKPGVAAAIEQHYFRRPRAAHCRRKRWQSASRSPTSSTRSPASSASGSRQRDKDPFGLRRRHSRGAHSRGEIAGARLLELLTLARDTSGGVVADSVAQDLHGFMLERLKPYLRDKLFEATKSMPLCRSTDALRPGVAAPQGLQAFRALPQAEALAAQQAHPQYPETGGGTAATMVNPALLREPASNSSPKKLRRCVPRFSRCSVPATMPQRLSIGVAAPAVTSSSTR